MTIEKQASRCACKGCQGKRAWGGIVSDKQNNLPEALAGERKEDVRVADIEMEVRESLREVGQSAMKCYLENADREVKAKIECKCGGKLEYQRRRAATIWSVFGKMSYERAYYAGCVCGKGCAILDERYGIEPGKVTAGLAQLLALSGIDKSFEEGQEWLKAFLLFEVSENTIRTETQAEQFGKLLWASGCSVFADRVRELIFVCDGATWIWKLVSHYYPNAIQIVDWYHAEERLERITEEAFSDLGERQPWLKKITEALWNGNVEFVIEACQNISKKSHLAKQALTYFSNHMERMRYAQFRTAGYLIGSGVIESACKQIVSRRLKLPGAQWNLEGAILTAKARCAWLSGHWQELISKRSLLSLAI
jgi:hypothetical protein